jgi:activator of HSP90 ATPase
MPESFTVSIVLPATAERIYAAWMDSREHALFTGGKAQITRRKGGNFTAWDDYISGKTLEMTPHKRIVQSWRTTEFPADAPDSQIEITLEPAEGGTSFTIRHTNIPDGQAEEYRQGWVDYYFSPMWEYFSGRERGEG